MGKKGPVNVKPPKGLLSLEESRAWMNPRPGRLAADLLGIWLQVAVALALFLHFPGPGVYLLTVVLIAGAQHACGLVAHEGAHYLLIPQNRPLNDRLCTWFFAAPVLLPFSTYRQRHMDHHRYVSTEDDTKELYRRHFRGWRLFWEVARSLAGLDFASQVLLTLKPRPGGRKPSGQSGGFLRDAAAIGVAQAILLAIAAIWDWRLYILLWVVPFVTVAQLFSKLRSAAEHQPLDSEAGHGLGPYFKGTPTPYLRSIGATPLEGLFLTRINFHYHAEHHLWPQVCYQYLPILHDRLKARPDFHGVVFAGSYLNVILGLARGQ